MAKKKRHRTFLGIGQSQTAGKGFWAAKAGSVTHRILAAADYFSTEVPFKVAWR